LRELDLPEAASLDALVRHIAHVRQRPIELVPVALGTSMPSGLWLALGDTDIVVYDAATAPRHRDHIIAHEVSHILCGHTLTSSPEHQAGTGALFPDLDPALVRAMLSRCTYRDEDEIEAEVMAFLLLRTTVRRPKGSAADAEGADGVAHRLEHSLLAPARTLP